MTQQLRDELARLADRSVDPHVSAGGVWTRGRRARRTDRLVTAAALVLVLVALGSVTALLATSPTRVAPAAPVEGRPAVPATLFPVPTHVQDDPSAYTSDLVVGPQAVAFVTGHGAPVVVSATDGSYRLLDLPGWPYGDDTDLMAAEYVEIRPLALSPDGTRLAWGYEDATGTGYRIADLTSGEVTDYPLRGSEFPGPTLRVTALAWSGDSDRVVWSGQTREPYENWYGHLLDLEAWAAERGPVAGAVTVGASSEGAALTYVDGDDFVDVTSPESIVADDSFRTSELDQPSPTASFSPSGRRVLFGTVSPQDHVEVADLDVGRVSPRSLPTSQTTTPLGWVDEDTAAVVSRSNSSEPEVALLSLSGPESYRAVTRTTPTDDSGAGARYHSVAVDLITDTEVVERPAPDWPMDPDRRALLLGLTGLAGVLALAAGGIAWARRHPLTPRR